MLQSLYGTSNMYMALKYIAEALSMRLCKINCDVFGVLSGSSRVSSG